MKNGQKGLVALTPLIVMLVVFLVGSLIAGDFYRIPISLAFLVATIYAILIAPEKGVARNVEKFSQGAGSTRILYMIWIFILAGAFATSAKAMGAVDATVELALRAIPSRFVPAGIFLATCFISMSIGTSVGTIVALTPVVTGLAVEMGVDTAWMVAIVVGGAFFGDNLSFISDTTIAATQTQGCAMRDKFRTNLRLVAPAAIITLLVYILYGSGFGEVTSVDIDAMVGYSWQNFYSKDRSITYYNETNEQYEKSTGVWGREESYLLSFYGRLNYSYASRYLLTVTLRADGSSKFAKGNRWGFFPSAAFAWNTLNEEFMQDQELFSTLKVRLGYGTTGQQEIGNYKYLARYNLSENDKSHQVIMGYDENGNPIYSYMLSPSAYDPNIRWESTTTYNAGVDFGMWDGLVEGSVDVYRRDTKDLLNWVTVPMGTNFGTNLLTNVGSMRNEGVEFSLNFNPIRTATQSLRIGFNGTFQDTYFTKLNKNDDPDYAIFMNSPGTGTGGQDLQMHTVGSAPYTFYAYKQGYTDGKPVQDGFYDLNGNGKIDEGDRYNTGKSPAPDFFFGLNLKYSYKNWDFGFNGHGSVGNYVFNSFYACHAASVIDTRGGLGNFATTVLRTGWTKPTSEKQDRSDLYIEDASFFRLDDINVGYTFDKLGGSNIKCRVAAGVQNVFVLTKYSGVDPEVSGVAGIDGTIWPRPRIFSLRLNLNF